MPVDLPSHPVAVLIGEIDLWSVVLVQPIRTEIRIFRAGFLLMGDIVCFPSVIQTDVIDVLDFGLRLWLIRHGGWRVWME